MKAMIFAAGLGTRLKPWTDSHPKALAVVNGKSLLQRNIEYLQLHGIYDVIVNVHHFADQIIRAIENNSGWGSRVTISDETTEVLETGGGLQKAAWYFENETNFVAINADVLTDLDLGTMLRRHKETGALATLATSIRNTSRYFLFDERNVLGGWENINTGEQKIKRSGKLLHRGAFSGVHIISACMLRLITQTGKFSMIDVYLSLAETHEIYSFDYSGYKFIDVGKPESIQKAEVLFA